MKIWKPVIATVLAGLAAGVAYYKFKKEKDSEKSSCKCCNNSCVHSEKEMLNKEEPKHEEAKKNISNTVSSGDDFVMVETCERLDVFKKDKDSGKYYMIGSTVETNKIPSREKNTEFTYGEIIDHYSDDIACNIVSFDIGVGENIDEYMFENIDDIAKICIYPYELMFFDDLPEFFNEFGNEKSEFDENK